MQTPVVTKQIFQEEDEDEIEDVITDNLSVECYAADLDVEQIEIMDIEEDN